MVLAYVAGSVIYNLSDFGMANFLGLESLSHGTSLTNYLSIRLNGGDPAYGGGQTGSTHSLKYHKLFSERFSLYNEKAKGYFFLFKDSEFNDKKPEFDKRYKQFLFDHIIYPLSPTFIFPSIHAFLAGNSIRSDISKIAKIKILLRGLGNVVATPLLRFRFSEIDSKRLENDPDFRRLKNDPVCIGMSYRTARKVEWWRIGMLGTLLVGINRQWIFRIQKNPAKFALGVTQIVAAIGLMYLCAGRITESRKNLIAAALGALLA